jgi:hypothetical protein
MIGAPPQAVNRAGLMSARLRGWRSDYERLAARSAARRSRLAGDQTWSMS